eukprot:6185824-Pyramimonas_sp.AAC.1
MCGQPAAFMLQDAVPTTFEETHALPEPLNTRRCVDSAVEREPAAVEEVDVFMGTWYPATLNLMRN